VTPFDDDFPGLRATGAEVSEEADPEFNCIGWAVGVKEWLWPPLLPASAWPDGILRQVSVDAFEAFFATYRFAPCDSEDVEEGMERVALFATAAGIPMHAARQLPSGRWTSKMGEYEVIEHALRALQGDLYGRVVRFFQRPARS
jgi:hypothetical protein